MIFVDANVFMYAVGDPHPLQQSAWDFFDGSYLNGVQLYTSAEVLVDSDEREPAFKSRSSKPQIPPITRFRLRPGRRVFRDHLHAQPCADVWVDCRCRDEVERGRASGEGMLDSHT